VRVGLAGENVLTVQSPIDADRFGKCFDPIIGLSAESAAPGFLSHDPDFRMQVTIPALVSS
jgi:hypothetical protein